MRRRLRARLKRLGCRLRPGGCRPDWAYTIACELQEPVCIRCGEPVGSVHARSQGFDEEIGVVCVEDPDAAW
jgi:hypothetical protein